MQDLTPISDPNLNQSQSGISRPATLVRTNAAPGVVPPVASTDGVNFDPQASAGTDEPFPPPLRLPINRSGLSTWSGHHASTFQLQEAL